MRRFFIRVMRLSTARKILFLRVSVLLLTVHTAIRLFSFSRVYQFLKRYYRQQQRPGSTAPADVCWAVTRAGRAWFGDEGCLVQAVVGEMLLARRGVDAQICIGVRKQDDGTLLAHAWVEAGGQTVIGGTTQPVRKEFRDLPQIQHVIR